MSDIQELSGFNPVNELFKFLLVALGIFLFGAALFVYSAPQASASQAVANYQQRAPLMHATQKQLALQTKQICKQTIADHKLTGEKMSAASLAYCGL